ncbi:MAG: hypothetical protein IT370_09330 [Deltaproteobacteria bacterium]|nr:hypothetical protein [Deltaproteobacteria bacterium]
MESSDTTEAGYMRAAVLIDRSVSHHEIAHAPYSEALADALALECDDGADTEMVREFWGTTDDGDAWRVHLDRAAVL